MVDVNPVMGFHRGQVVVDINSVPSFIALAVVVDVNKAGYGFM